MLLNDNRRNEAIFHVVTSTERLLDPFEFPPELRFKNAFNAAIEHVKRYHYPELSNEDIEEARQKLNIDYSRQNNQ